MAPHPHLELQRALILRHQLLSPEALAALEAELGDPSADLLVELHRRGRLDVERGRALRQELAGMMLGAAAVAPTSEDAVPTVMVRPTPRISAPGSPPQDGWRFPVEAPGLDGGATFRGAPEATPPPTSASSAAAIPAGLEAFAREGAWPAEGRVWARLGGHIEARVELASAAATRARLEHTAGILAELSHPGIERLIARDVAGEPAWFAVEDPQRPSLDERLGSEPLNTSEAWMLAEELSEALAASHRAGIIHRALEPRVLDWGPGRLVVRGWQASKRADAPEETAALSRAELELPAGALSPELADGRWEALDARSDVYAFGAILTLALTGEPPFPGDGGAATLAAVLREQAPPIRSRRPEVPERLAAIIDRCLQREPRRRYADAEALRRELLGVTARPQRRSMIPLLALGALLALALFALALVVAVFQRRERRQATEAADALIELRAAAAETRQEAARAQLQLTSGAVVGELQLWPATTDAQRALLAAAQEACESLMDPVEAAEGHRRIALRALDPRSGTQELALLGRVSLARAEARLTDLELPGAALARARLRGAQALAAELARDPEAAARAAADCARGLAQDEGVERLERLTWRWLELRLDAGLAPLTRRDRIDALLEEVGGADPKFDRARALLRADLLEGRALAASTLDPKDREALSAAEGALAARIKVLEQSGAKVEAFQAARAVCAGLPTLAQVAGRLGELSTLDARITDARDAITAASQRGVGAGLLLDLEALTIVLERVAVGAQRGQTELLLRDLQAGLGLESYALTALPNGRQLALQGLLLADAAARVEAPLPGGQPAAQRVEAAALRAAEAWPEVMRGVEPARRVEVARALLQATLSRGSLVIP